MKNIERLAKFVTKNGTEDIMVHTIAGSTNWLVCQKMEKDKWLLTMANPMGNVTYNLGTINDKQHFQLWVQLTKMEIDKKTSQIIAAKKMKQVIYNFKQNYGQSYQKFTKVEEKGKKVQNMRKTRRKSK